MVVMWPLLYTCLYVIAGWCLTQGTRVEHVVDDVAIVSVFHAPLLQPRTGRASAAWTALSLRRLRRRRSQGPRATALWRRPGA